MKYRIQCYINNIDDKGSFEITGAENYIIEHTVGNEKKKYNLFIEDQLSSSKELKIASYIITYKFTSVPNEKNQIFNFILQAQINHKKIELEIEIKNETDGADNEETSNSTNIGIIGVKIL
jgi:hypothetical protein